MQCLVRRSFLEMFVCLLFGWMISGALANAANETSCEPRTSQKNTTQILRDLRREMQMEGIGIYVIFSDDEHGSEYTQESDRRRDWLTGFRGSAGIAVVTLRTAALWTDGRYFTQAEEELDCANWLLMRDGKTGVPGHLNWIVSEANQTTLVTRLNVFVTHRSFSFAR
jgi:Xaa-Pro aminopeptidase